MADFLSAYAEAERLFGDVELTTGQLAQLRASDAAHQRRLFALLHAAGRSGEPSAPEIDALRRQIDADLFALLSPEQRRALRR